MKIQMPYYKQTTKMTCWYFSVKMIHDYHKYGEAKQKRFLDVHQVKVEILENTVSFLFHNGPTEHLKPRGFEMLDFWDFNENSSVEALEKLLDAKGPLLAVSYTDGHAVVVCGAGMAAAERMTTEGVNLIWDDKKTGVDMDAAGVWINDPFRGADQKAGLKELKFGFKYLGWGQTITKDNVLLGPTNNNLWYFVGKESKSQGFVYPRFNFDALMNI